MKNYKFYKIITGLLVLAALSTIISCAKAKDEAGKENADITGKENADINRKNLYWGDLHAHSSLSLRCPLVLQ
ncbi:MAG: hypothetical protein H8D96_20750 [Desulfobacterales bacterium]|uniref:DUF3604 domain-containing protein n=1 Tax=Candidatus Desulfatibia vada TaxID=2841696 RepID=A0A8J6TPA3_9BACT|nr:hypothetical protein [Candidatus Desulfatibia vada]MBL6972220.1 hypothetical protein [Desulfobacterales bacterium]